MTDNIAAAEINWIKTIGLKNSDDSIKKLKNNEK